MKISVVIPVYGCKTALEELYTRLVKTIETISDEMEIILVNDNCPQNSWEVIESLCNRDPRVKGIELSRNFGQMKAILAGLDYATGDWIVVMDCDLQDRPEEIVNLYKKALEGYDVVFARRATRRDSYIKVALANLFYKVYEFATDVDYDGAVCNFSLVKKDVIQSYCSMREMHRSYVIYLKWLGYRQATIDVQHDERYEGKSAYDLGRRINMAFDILTSQSDKILKMTVKFGLFMAFMAFVVIIGLVIYSFCENVTTGWTSLIASQFLVGGIIIAVIGIVGIYVGNVFMQVKERPLYVIRQVLNDKE